MDENNNKIICYCSGVGEREILDAIKNGARTLYDIQEKTSACTLGRCKELSPKKKCCSADIIKILRENGCY